MAEKLWGGRFSKKTHPLVEEFTRSIQYDSRLAEYDVLGSITHVAVLGKSGYLKSKEASLLIKTLTTILKEIRLGTYKPDLSCEDIHTDIQNKLQKKVGDLALKLHTARSRNDQVAFATKLFCKASLNTLIKLTEGLIHALKTCSRKHKGMIIPGFTHLQLAQPVYLADYLGAYCRMLSRDMRKLEFISSHISLSMGAGALAGTPIKSDNYRGKIGALNIISDDFAGVLSLEPTVNSLDSVSDRDFVIDILSAIAVMGMHLSRFSEDILIWSTKEFSYVDIDESFCTGSSLMPQKKNADVLELVRGYTGKLNGNLVAVLTMMKGLPLSYNRDMQHDKEPLFDSLDIAKAQLEVLAPLVETLTFNKSRISQELAEESLYATDLVYYLVDKGLAFKTAHSTVGKLVKYCQDNSLSLHDISQEKLAEFSALFKKREVIKLLDPEVSVKSKRSLKRG